MRPIERLVADLRKVEVFGGRVYPVVAPIERTLMPGQQADPSRAEWPICVWGRTGGAAMTMIGSDGPKLPLVQVDVLGLRYADVEEAMHEVVARLKTWLTPDPPSDRWDETLSVYRQSVIVSLSQE